MKTVFRPTLVFFGALTLMCAVVYPLVMAGIGQLAFPDQVGGSILLGGGKPVGSRLIGQEFSSPRYFWGRPSATSPMAYNAASSSGANFGPTNPALIDEAKGRIAALKAADPDNQAPIPVDLVTSSASGLDPEISVAAIYYQIARVARERKLDPTALRTLVDRQARTSVLGFLGEPRVNLLVLNLALDRLQQNQTTGALPEAGRRASLGVDSSPDADA